MKILINISIAFLLIVFLVKSENVFVATNEWQEIKEGQSVPAGLHYRMNLETGKKEAKIIDPVDTDSQETTAPILSDANPKEGNELLSFLKKLVKSKFCILANFFHFGARLLIDCFLEVSRIKKNVQSNKYGFLK